MLDIDTVKQQGESLERQTSLSGGCRNYLQILPAPEVMFCACETAVRCAGTK